METKDTPVFHNMKRVIISMDVEAMYPSLIKEVCKREIKKVVRETEVEIDNLNWKKIAIQILQRVNKGDHKNVGIGRIIPNKKIDLNEDSND